MKNGYALQGQGPHHRAFSVEGLPHQAAKQELTFSLTDPITLLVRSELWQSLSADTRGCLTPWFHQGIA